MIPGGEGPVCLAEAAFPETPPDAQLPKLLIPTAMAGVSLAIFRFQAAGGLFTYWPQSGRPELGDGWQMPPS